MVSSQESKTDEGYIIKAGICTFDKAISFTTQTSKDGYPGYWCTFKFDQPFPTTCYGVVLTQSNGYVPEYGANGGGSTWNTAVTKFDASTFTTFSGAAEIATPIYYIAFGK